MLVINTHVSDSFLVNNFADFPYSAGKKIKSSSSRWWRFVTQHLLLQSIYVTWSRRISRMSGILIWSCRLKEVANSYVLHCFELRRIVHISATRSPHEMEFWIKMWHFKSLRWKIKLQYCGHETRSPWWCHICTQTNALAIKQDFVHE